MRPLIASWRGSDARRLAAVIAALAIADALLALPVGLEGWALFACHAVALLGLLAAGRAYLGRTGPARDGMPALQDRAANDHAELRVIIDNIPAMVALVDGELRYRFVNRQYERWLGRKPAEMLGRRAREVLGEEQFAEKRQHLERALSGSVSALDHRMTSLDGSADRWFNTKFVPRFGADGLVTGVYVVSSDTTDITLAERRALFLEAHDELTTLPNRASFQTALAQALDGAARDGTRLAVLIVDVDRFKVVNDTLGHAAGDHLLQALAERMKQVVRGKDLVARMGGDEMGVLLHDVQDGRHAGDIAGRILTALRVPFELRSGVLHHATVSAGISVFPTDGSDAQTLLRHSDIAMYRAKAAGRDGFSLFGAHAVQPEETRLNLELELRTAIDTGQLVLHYQPRVDITSGRAIGMEALVRWAHPERGLLSPLHFIGIAEETGLVVPMGAWVMRQAAQALRRLEAAGLAGLTMSVNVSARQFDHSGLVDEVAAMIRDAGCEAGQIELELTESAVMAKPDDAEATMHRLKALGVRLAIDDFGTGHSSLAALKRFPVDCVKIDRSFVNDIPTDPDDVALTRAIIAMGQSLGLYVVAEGVERADQLEFLHRHGCDEYQGYLFAKPLPEQAFTALLLERAEEPAGVDA